MLLLFSVTNAILVLASCLRLCCMYMCMYMHVHVYMHIHNNYVHVHVSACTCMLHVHVCCMYMYLLSCMYMHAAGLVLYLHVFLYACRWGERHSPRGRQRWPHRPGRQTGDPPHPDQQVWELGWGRWLRYEASFCQVRETPVSSHMSLNFLYVAFVRVCMGGTRYVASLCQVCMGGTIAPSV